MAIESSKNIQHIADLKQKLDDLEVGHAYHDDSIHELEKTVATQHQEIQLLRKQIAILSEHIKTMREAAIKDPQDEVPPPHY